MKMPESAKMAMMKCMCDSCKSYEECLSTAIMAKMKAFCTMGNAMENMKEVCTMMEEKDKCMDEMKMESKCMDKIKMEDCVCKECPVQTNSNSTT
jgi:hypothetical protein